MRIVFGMEITLDMTTALIQKIVMVHFVIVVTTATLKKVMLIVQSTNTKKTVTSVTGTDTF